MRLLTVTPTTLLLSLCTGLAACSSSADSPIHLATDAGSGTASDAAKSGTDASSGSSSAASSSSAGSSSASSAGSSDAGGTAAGCAADAGATINAKWDFAVSTSTDGGPGQVLTAHVCDTVVWTNDDNGTPHSVVSDPSSAFQFMTATVTGTTAGAVFGPVQFTKAGTFGYHCGVHPTMTGQITVQ